MRTIRISFFLTLLISATFSFGQQEFLNELGTEKAESFQKLVKSYERFLQLNYPNIEGVGEQTKAYMNQMIEYANYGKKPVKYDSLDAIEIIIELEQSGLRKDIFIYLGEVYEPTYNIQQFLPDREVEIDTNEIDDDFEYENIDYSQLDTSSREPFIAITPDERKREKERGKKALERRKWLPDINTNGLYYYALLKTDDGFVGYRDSELHPGITQILLDLTSDELEDWRVQLTPLVDFYFLDILFRYKRHMTGY